MRQIQHAKNLWNMSRVDADRSGKSRWEIIKDTIECRKKYGCSINDYLCFGFSMLDKAKREEYFTLRMNYMVTKQINDMAYENKWKAYQDLSEYYKRDLVHLVESSPEEVEFFVGKHQEFFAKDPDSSGGKGIEFIRQGETRALNGVKLAEQLKEEGFVLLEEPIQQHEEMKKLNPSSVNTIRVISITNPKGEVIFLPFVLRVGATSAKVDNVRSGGLYTFLNDEGVVDFDGFYQESHHDDVLIIKEHPMTGMNPKGFQIPFFQEGIDMLREMASKLPQVPLIGWDLCISPDGPLVIELNCFPSIDFNQNYYFTELRAVDSVGAKKIIEEHLDIKIQYQENFPVEYLGEKPKRK